MSEDIHKWTDGRYTLMFDEHTFFVWDNEKEERMTALQVTKKLNEQQANIQSLKEENEQLKEQVQILNECCRFKSSDEAIKQAYADLNCREREKHSQGNVTYTTKINQNEVIY